MNTNAAATKTNVVEVFDSLAAKKAWEGLYSGNLDRLSYNFVTRQRAVEELLTPLPIANALDIGCGTGDLLPYFVGRGTQYTGLDISPKMIERAEANHPAQIASGKARFVVGDSEGLPFRDAEFDAVTAVALIEYLPDAGHILDETCRVLKPGGYALFTVPHKDCINFAIRDVLAPFRNLAFPLYVKLKGGALSKMKDVKHYHYNPPETDSMMESRGLRKVGARFSNFYVIPHPLDHLVPGLYMRLSEKIDRSAHPEKYSLLAANYMGLYQKPAN